MILRFSTQPDSLHSQILRKAGQKKAELNRPFVPRFHASGSNPSPGVSLTIPRSDSPADQETRVLARASVSSSPPHLGLQMGWV
jgi:hypothetical protein